MTSQNVRKFRIMPKDIKQAEEFADLRCAENQELYERRGGFKRADIVAGALGELAAYKMLTNWGFEVNKPDFTIHDRVKKSFNADFIDEKGHHFHVKSQSMESVKRYGRSWIMQRHDPIIRKPRYNHYLLPTVVDLENNEVRIYGTYSIHSIVTDNKLGECRAPMFRATKVALYLEDLDSYSNKAKWAALRKQGKYVKKEDLPKFNQEVK